MKIFHYALSLICIGIFLGSIIAPNVVSAQISITLYPVSFRIQVDPGESYNETVTIVNPNDVPLGVQPEKENLGGGAEGSVQLLGEDQNAYGLASWISLNENPVVLQPQEKHDFPFIINVPKNAQPGGHYASVLFRAISAEEASGAGKSGVGISGRVGTVILIEVSGEIQKSAQLASVTGPTFVSHGPIEVSVRIQNTGNSYFTPEGTVTFQNLFSKQEIPISPTSKVVFPGFDRTYKVSWDKRYVFGPVFATVVAKIPGSNTIGTQRIIIWAWPWQETLIAVAFLGLAWFGIHTFKTKFKIVKVDSTDKTVTFKTEGQTKINE